MASIRDRTVQWIDPISGRRKTRTFSTPDVARRFAEDRDEELRLVRDGRLSAAQLKESTVERTPIAAAITEYRRYREKRTDITGRTDDLKNVLRAIETIVDRCSIHTVADLTARKVDRFLQEKLDEGASGRTHNFYRRAMFGFCKRLVKFDYLSENPIEAIDPMPDEVASPSRPLTVLECEALLAAAGGQSAARRLHYLLRLRTGLRGSECKRLRWSDVNLERGLLSLRAEVTKNRKADVLPLADDLVEALVKSQAEALRRGQPFGPDDPVFPSIPNRLTWQRDLERAGIPERAPMSKDNAQIGRADRKCLRTTFGSHQNRARVDLTIISLLMRHTPVGGMKLTLETYGDPDAILARKREAIEKLTAWYHQQVETLATGSAAG